ANPTDVTFTAVQNGATPGDRTVAITNGGSGTLSGLSATVRYAAGEPTGWLTPSLGNTTAPTTLVLAANQRSFTPGTYNATVDISSPGTTTRSITAHLTVSGPTPTIGLGSTTAAFSTVVNGTDPPAQQVTVSNLGGGILNGLATSVDYAPGQRTGWLTATMS